MENLLSRSVCLCLSGLAICECQAIRCGQTPAELADRFGAVPKRRSARIQETSLKKARTLN